MSLSCLIDDIIILYMKEILLVIFALLIPNWVVARIDLDGNGLSDVWEKIYGGGMSANNDDDYDGRSNLEEEIREGLEGSPLPASKIEEYHTRIMSVIKQKVRLGELVLNPESSDKMV